MNSWDNPVVKNSGFKVGQTGQVRHKGHEFKKQATLPEDGLLDPFAFLMFLFKNSLKILILTALLTLLGFFIFTSLPFPYKATAIILVDPREKGITVSEQVIANIDGDAAVLESIVELVQSDAFIKPLLETLNVMNDPQFYGEARFARQGDDRALLNSFKRGLQVLRLGATYVVEVNYTADSSEKAAFYANGIARAFVEEQASSQLSATSNAASSLADRLAELSKVLQQSEKAVADYRRQQNIVSIDGASTLLQRELSALSQEVAEAKSNTEVWRAQYDQVRTNNDVNFNTLGDQAETQTLQNLNQQKAQISQNLAQLNLTFGTRHPRITAERSRLIAIDQQIDVEKQRLVGLSKKRLDAAIATQNALQSELDLLRDKAGETETALVRLGELEREAAANREIYEDFLSRFKSAKEQRGFQNREARLASPASEPLYSTRPSKALAGGVIFLLSLIISTLLVLGLEILRGKRPAFNRKRSSFSQNQDFERDPPNPVQGNLDSRFENAFSRPSSPHFEEMQPFKKPVARNWNERFFVPKKKRGTVQRDRVSGNSGFNHAASSRLDEKRTFVDHQPSYQDNFPVSTITHISRSRLRHEVDLERAIAYQLKQDREFLPSRHGYIVLVTSWSANEGKTTLAQSMATLGYESNLETILIKTPANAQIEMGRGLSSSQLRRPYTIFDASRERVGRTLAHHRSFRAFEAIIEECRSSFDYAVIDASSIGSERYIDSLSRLVDKTVVVFNRPDGHEINIMADKTTRAEFHNLHIILNNI